VTVGVVGDFNPASRSHRATDAALGHAARALGVAVSARWLPTDSLTGAGGRGEDRDLRRCVDRSGQPVSQPRRRAACHPVRARAWLAARGHL